MNHTYIYTGSSETFYFPRFKLFSMWLRYLCMWVNPSASNQCSIWWKVCLDLTRLSTCSLLRYSKVQRKIYTIIYTYKILTYLQYINSPNSFKLITTHVQYNIIMYIHIIHTRIIWSVVAEVGNNFLPIVREIAASAFLARWKIVAVLSAPDAFCVRGCTCRCIYDTRVFESASLYRFANKSCRQLFNPETEFEPHLVSSGLGKL